MRILLGCLAVLLCVSAEAQTQNIKDLRLVDGVSTSPRFRFNGDGKLRSYTSTGVVTGEWDATSGNFTGTVTGGVGADDVLAGTLGTDVLVQNGSLSADVPLYTGDDLIVPGDMFAESGFVRGIGVWGTSSLTAGYPTGSIGFGAAGSVNGVYGLFSDDVHSLDTVYGSQGVVVGNGRTNPFHDGSLVLMTSGTLGGSPIAGQVQSRIFNDNKGLHFQNAYGSISNVYDFDKSVHVQGDVATSGTARIAGATSNGNALAFGGAGKLFDDGATIHLIGRGYYAFGSNSSQLYLNAVYGRFGYNNGNFEFTTYGNESNPSAIYYYNATPANRSVYIGARLKVGDTAGAITSGASIQTDSVNVTGLSEISGLDRKVRTITTNDTAVLSDNIIVLNTDSAAAALTLYLPNLATCVGQTFEVILLDSSLANGGSVVGFDNEDPIQGAGGAADPTYAFSGLNGESHTFTNIGSMWIAK